MRALRVVGLGIDGRTVILETVAQRSGERRERFTLPADEGLHAAVRGDLPRLGQIEIELESQMRPREIQTRIRAGESVEQVATAAGVPSERIERFAYPVLLERSRTAQLAQQAHPVRSDGPDVRTLEEVVSETFSQRGHDYAAVTWDSWRGENGKWVVQLHWLAGRSDNRAHWTFHPGAHGGTVTAIDDHATDLIDPQPATQLRPVPPVAPVAPVVPVPPVTPLAGSIATPTSHEPTQREQRRVPDPLIQHQHPAWAVPDDGPAYRPAYRPGERPAAEHREPQAPTHQTPTQQPPTQQPPSHQTPSHQTPTQQPPTRQTPAQPPAVPAPPPAPKRGRKDRPIVPSWEDVLLGVRSPRE
ncbi:MAG: septation protein SepH [Pseudonocardiaceae bacterium]